MNPTTAMPEWGRKFWNFTPPPTAWHQIWNIIQTNLVGSWTQWNNHVLNTQLSIWLGQILTTLLALTPILWALYKTTMLIKGRHRTLNESQSAQSNSSIVHVHNKVQFRDDARDQCHGERQKINRSLEKYEDHMAILAWLIRLEMSLETHFDREDWARETIKLLSDKAILNISPVDRSQTETKRIGKAIHPSSPGTSRGYFQLRR